MSGSIVSDRQRQSAANSQPRSTSRKTKWWYFISFPLVLLFSNRLVAVRNTDGQTSTVDNGVRSLQVRSVTSGFLRDYTPEQRIDMNSRVAVKGREKLAKSTTPVYRHREMIEAQFGKSATLFLHLVLRTLTHERIFSYPLPEPFVHEKEQNKRVNSGCDRTSPGCIFTLDAWARAMITADIVIDTILTRGVPGVVVEVGVFKGGMSAYLQALLVVTGQADRRDMWLVDSFQGIPPPDLMVSKNANMTNKYNSNEGGQAKWSGWFNCSLDKVKHSFDRLGLLGNNVKFRKGYVEHSLPGWTVQSIAVLRIDVDLYAATYDVLHYLYPHLEVGGVVLLDDWGLWFAADAVFEYREKHNIDTPIEFLPGTATPMAYWIKDKELQ